MTAMNALYDMDIIASLTGSYKLKLLHSSPSNIIVIYELQIQVEIWAVAPHNYHDIWIVL